MPFKLLVTFDIVKDKKGGKEQKNKMQRNNMLKISDKRCKNLTSKT